jgi:hypothetical protein
MVTFDAELYLRLLGERLLQDPDQQRHQHRSPLDVPAAALVAAGTVAPGLAWRVIDDYAAAAQVRAGEHGFRHFGASALRRQAGRLTPRHTMVLDREISFGAGQLLLRDLAIGENGGTLRFRWRRDGPGSSRGASHMMGRPGGFPWGSTAPAVVDDRGNRLTVGTGSGGGSDDLWDGKLELGGALALDTAWLEVDGTRIELGRRTAPWEVRIEALDEQDPIERFLWRRLAVAELPFRRTADVEPAIEALFAAGSLGGDDHLVRDLRAVAARMPAHHRRRHRPRGGGGRGLLEPWRSLLRREGKDGGPTRTLVVGALTPQFDGVQFAANSITSDSQGFEVEFEVAPNVLHAPALEELPVAWWARDDRGNHYLGTPGGWGGDDEHAEGTLVFWPALDPRATRLELVVCADAHRAVVSVSFADSPAGAA